MMNEVQRAELIADYWSKKPNWKRPSNLKELVLKILERVDQDRKLGRELLGLFIVAEKMKDGHFEQFLNLDILTNEVLLYDPIQTKFESFSNDDLKWLDANGFILSEEQIRSTGQQIEDWIYDE